MEVRKDKTTLARISRSEGQIDTSKTNRGITENLSQGISDIYPNNHAYTHLVERVQSLAVYLPALRF